MPGPAADGSELLRQRDQSRASSQSLLCIIRHSPKTTAPTLTP